MFDLVFDFILEGLDLLKWYIPLYIAFGFIGDLVAEARERRR